MCGIAGIFSLDGRALPPVDYGKVLGALRHRGPDDEGSFLDQGVFLGARRLAIIDPEKGHQPVSDEFGRLHLVMNGEIYDYDGLLEDLQDRGHHFRSHCDTEVAVHLFEEDWYGALERMDGQFAVAVYDRFDRRLLLARDRMGISPLFYAVRDGLLVFASEMKAIFATGLVKPGINPRALDAVAAFGCVPAPWAVFEGVRALPPGRLLEVRDGRLEERTFWDVPYPEAGEYPERKEEEWVEEFLQVFGRAVKRRLKADVPVGLYLSGGIDSASVALMTAGAEDVRSRVFSIGFEESGFDESDKIRMVAEFLGLDAQVLTYPQGDLARDLPRLVRHAETPLVSTESVPLMALSGLASRHVKVVLTGEGSDEALGGYRYFRWEALKGSFGRGMWGGLVLRFLRRKFRKVLGERNPFFPLPEDEEWAERVFGFYPAGMMQMFYWRMLRGMVYSEEMMARQAEADDAEFLDLPREEMARWDQLNRSLYVSSRVFMTGHLLGAHGDRALMANSVEGRYPFLDRKVQEFLAQVPPGLKTKWRREKYLLRRAMDGRLPREVVMGRKKPFLAPFGTPFVGDGVPDYARELLAPGAISEYGYFDPAKVSSLVKRVEGHAEALRKDQGESLRLDRAVVERTLDGMALTFVLSTQVLESQVRAGEFDG